MPSGCFGPRAQAVVGYLTGRLGLSHRDVTESLEALYRLEIGLGSIAAIQQRVSAALEQPVETVQKFAIQQSVHHVDETGWPGGSGSRFVERILTAVTTLRQQGRDVLDYLTAACAYGHSGMRVDLPGA